MMTKVQSNKGQIPEVNEKVKINDVFGTIVEVYPPCSTHSGRFDVLIHDKYRTYISEFWFSDYGTSIISVKRK